MKHTIFVWGELNADLIVSGDDVTPEMNREKLVNNFDVVLGSSSAITACCLSGLGNNVHFIGIVGEDQFGLFCIQELKKNNVDTSYITIDPNVKTGVTLSLSTKKDRALLTYMGAISKLNINHIPNEIYRLADHIHFGSYFLQEDMRPHWNHLFSKAKSFGISTSFDTGWDPSNKWYTRQILDLLSSTDLFIPSEDELFKILPIKNINNLTHYLPTIHGNVAVKQGERGSTLLNREEQILKADPYNVTPVDLTGAGDSFNAGIITGYLTGMDEEEMLMFANACGAIATQRIGGASNVPTFDNVRNFQKQNKVITKD